MEGQKEPVKMKEKIAVSHYKLSALSLLVCTPFSIKGLQGGKQDSKCINKDNIVCRIQDISLNNNSIFKGDILNFNLFS